MKVHLLHPDGDAVATTVDGADLAHDVGLADVVAHMAGRDPFLRDVAQATLLRPLSDVAAIAWRQDVLADCIAAPDAIRALHRIAAEGAAAEGRVRGWWVSSEPSSVLSHSASLMRALLGPLRDLQRWAADTPVSSDGLRALCARLTELLPDEWFALVDQHLRRLQMADVVMTARLGPGGKGTGHVLHSMEPTARVWRAILGGQRSDNATVMVPESDNVGAQALLEQRDRGIALVAGALAQAAQRVLGFFLQLRWETGFYVGCLNLREAARGLGLPLATPEARPAGRELAARGLYDVGLALRSGRTVVGNDLMADGADAVVVTGANRGGKSTLLRAVGLAQLMMQAGMFVGAEEFRASVVGRVHTHFRREEDERLRSGKLHEELARMSRIVDRASPGDLLLSNESFASTNERDGSRITRQLVDGLIEGGLRVVLVTHLYEFSHDLAAEARPDVVFLRAERTPDGERTFKVAPGEPLPTSYGADLWTEILGRDR